MRFLFFSQYYLPETGAPQNRLSGLARELKSLGHEVEVLTAMPNYPQMKIQGKYQGKFYFVETIENVKVYRSWIFAGKKSGIILRLINYFSFVITSWMNSFRIKSKFDYVLCESPPLFAGITAYLISKRKKAKFIFNVSDLWPESAVKLNLFTNQFFLNIAYRLEAWLYKKSFLVTGQTKGICTDIITRFPETIVHWLPNGIDKIRFTREIKSGWRLKNNFSRTDFIILYAGIIGHAQGLETIISAAAKLKENSLVKFVFIGDGPEKLKLQNRVIELNLKTVFFFDSVSSELITEVLKDCNATVVPLKKLNIFLGAIPSKIFESLAMSKPILLGVEGEAKNIFIDEGSSGLSFIPEDSDDLVKKIFILFNDHALCQQLGENGSKLVMRDFDRKKIASDFLHKINSIQ